MHNKNVSKKNNYNGTTLRKSQTFSVSFLQLFIKYKTKINCCINHAKQKRAKKN